MATHQFNENMLPDDHFVGGDLKYLVTGNECRLLDQRRTPGIIKSLDFDGGYFRWEITDFEDKGKYWDVPFEQANSYQFIKESQEASASDVERLQNQIKVLDKQVEIIADVKQQQETEARISELTESAGEWLSDKSEFFKSGEKIDFQSNQGPILLRSDLLRFMDETGLIEQEKMTSEVQVMNPHSGDWIRGIQIVMAEMGLKDYLGKAHRSPSTFDGIGSQENRKKYISHRFAFIRAYFKKLGLSEAPLYRGMVTEWDWSTGGKGDYRFWSSWTFNYQIAQDFTALDPNNKYKNSYLVKRAMPVEKIFMTFLETEAMNKQYLEAEALVLHSDEDKMLW